MTKEIKKPEEREHLNCICSFSTYAGKHLSCDCGADEYNKGRADMLTYHKHILSKLPGESELVKIIKNAMGEFYATHQGKAKDYRKWLAKALSKRLQEIK